MTDMEAQKPAMKDEQRLLCVEGLIGVGKTPYIEALGKRLEFYAIPEPVLEWRRAIDSQSLLENLYKDYSRWSYTFQVNSLLTRAQALEEEAKMSRGRDLVMERSLISDRECFGRMCFDTGRMSPLEWYWYSRYYEYMTHGTKHPDGFIYLRIEPTTALKRIGDRARAEETGLTLDYLQDLHRRYEALFGGGEVVTDQGTIPVLVLDCDDDNDAACFDRNVEAIVPFVKNGGFSLLG